MASQGHGISDAVRNTVREWIDDATARSLATDLGLGESYRHVLRDPDMWKRINKRGPRMGPSTRTYRCNGLPASSDLILEVRTNAGDTHINYFAIRANGKVVDAGVSNVASVFQSSKGNKARVATAAAAANAPAVVKGGFRKMSAAEIQQINTETDFDTFSDMFEQRDA